MAQVGAPARSTGELGAWLAFAGCLIGVFMQMIDVTIVNVALPDITAELGASRAQQLLVISGYSLAFACTLLPAARLGALTGRRVMFLASVLAFTAASVWCGIADGATELVVARVVQGVAGAGMAAQTIAILTASFPRERHPLVFALYGACAGFAGMLGPLLGGLLISADLFGLGWHVIFLMNVPLGVAAFALAWRYLRIGKPDVRGRFDVRGAVLSAMGLFLLLFALAEVHNRGWRLDLVAMMAVAVAIGAGFLVSQRRLFQRDGSALVRLDLFADKGFRIGSVLVAVFFGLFTAFVFAVSITMQDILDWSPLRTGLSMTPFALGAGAGALASPFLVPRFGIRALAFGMALFSGCIGSGAVYLWLTSGVVNPLVAIGPVVASGFGVGLFGVQLQPIMLSGLDLDRMGEASGVLPTVEQIGNAVGLAALTAVFFRAHTLDGAVVMLAAVAAVALCLAVATLTLPEPSHRP
ncbi:MFS transporter [Nocardia puris]|uniref:EmrB/QacA subfamily drug resistance transporter n=1 Tax=Nocardia puris TaxID=208602 RepID=A0A366DJ05_9NOCA|nr:MFS transporter [Nocardia puris]RBO89489.1 EmrB/QacA subfamily drug resistance transporter [Nocardia puris]